MMNEEGSNDPSFCAGRPTFAWAGIRQIAQFLKKFLQNFVQFAYCNLSLNMVYYYCQGAIRPMHFSLHGTKKFSKIFEKPLDKYIKV